MLRKSLAGVVEPDAFEVAEISPTARPEELDVDAWCRLADATRPGAADATRPGAVDATRPGAADVRGTNPSLDDTAR
jgi:hypothetical protein